MVVFASLLLTPRASEAACGDYVQVSGRSTVIHSIPDHATSADGTSVNTVDHRAPRRPCRGPGCSNGSFPSQIPVPTVVVSIERWALAPADTLPVIVCCNHVLAEPVDLHVDGFRLSILRPPR